MTVGMQKEKSATATGMRMSDVFFGFLWQISFTNDNVLNPLSVFGACLVVSSIFVLVFNKSVAPTGADTASTSTDIELGTKVDGDVYSALRSEMNDSEHQAEAESVILMNARENVAIAIKGGMEDEEEEKTERSSSNKENHNAINTPGGASVMSTTSPDTVDVILGKESSVIMKDTYTSLSLQFGDDDDDEALPTWGSAENDERWDVDFDALKKEFDV